MKDRAKEIYRKAETFYRETYDELAKLADDNADERNVEELADAALALREAHAMIERIKIRMHFGKEEAERRACLIAVKREQIDPIETPYVVARMKLQINPRLPKRKSDPEGFARVMEALGVPRELWDTGRESDPVISVNWKGMVQLATDRAAAGYPLPGGISSDNTKPIYRLHLRKRKEILEDHE